MQRLPSVLGGRPDQPISGIFQRFEILDLTSELSLSEPAEVDQDADGSEQRAQGVLNAVHRSWQ
jgi:hypothetical protein